MLIYFNGLILGLSLIMSLGPQNIFLMRQGAQRKHATLSALVCFFCDAILIAGSVLGMHHAIESYPRFRMWMIWFGVVFLWYYGAKILSQAFARQSQETIFDESIASRMKIIGLALCFSLLNPQAIIDTLVIIGGNSNQFPGHQQAFVLGVITSSLVWFTSLTFTTRYFSNVLMRPKVWRCVEMFSGVLMLILSIKLAWQITT